MTEHMGKDGLIRLAVVKDGAYVCELDARECFVLRALLDGGRMRALHRKYRRQFWIPLSQDTLNEFIARMIALGVLEEAADATVPEAKIDSSVSESNIQDDIAHPADSITANCARGADNVRKKQGQSSRGRWPLADPMPLLRPLTRLSAISLWWVRLLPILLAITITYHFHHWPDIAASYPRLIQPLTLLAHLAIGALCVNLLSVIAQGATFVGFGGIPRSFGVSLALGLFRFYVDRSPLRQFGRREQLWCLAAPLLAKLSLISLGTLAWAITRQSGSSLADFAFILAHIALIAFLFSVNPLWVGAGYQWLATYFGKPQLREHALEYLKRSLSRHPPPPLPPREKFAYLAYALCSLIFIIVVLGSLLAMMAIKLKQQYGGLGVILFIGAAAFIIFLVRRRFGRRARGSKPVSIQQAEPAGSSPERRLWLPFFLLLLAVAWLIPYTYETSGAMRVLAAERSQVYVDLPGLVSEIYVREGDLVRSGQPVARIDDQSASIQLAQTQSALEKSMAELKLILGGAKPEAIDKARQEVRAVANKIDYLRTQARRSEELLKKGFISQSGHDLNQQNLQQAIEDLKTAEAALKLVTSPPLPDAVAAAEANVRQLEHEIASRQHDIELHILRARSDGRVITPNVHFQLGVYLERGDKLLEIEATGKILVAVDVPETDINLLQTGNAVVMKPWGIQGRDMEGSVIAIAPTAENRDFGKIVRVTVEAHSHDMPLKSDTTGYAKIRCQKMSLLEAFTRAIVRFVMIEMWSWIP